MRAPTLPPPVDPSPRRKRRQRSLLLSFLGFMFAAGVVVFLAGSAVAGYLLYKASQDLPSYESLAKYEPPVMTRIHAHDGSMIAEYARERRIFVPINNVPKMVINAYLSAEDRRFYQHNGLDFIGIGRAVTKAVQSAVKRDNRRSEGASTITQQVAKNFLLSADRTLERKIKEAILAIRIERSYDKEKILELYLNQIFLGNNSYGIGAASLNYFSKELKDLTIEEAAYLAALPKAPSNYHPFRKTKEATTRRNWIIDEMIRNGFVTAEDGKAAKDKPLTVNLRSVGTQIYAADYFAEEVRRQLLTMFGEDGLYGRAETVSSGDGRVNGGLSVRTTLDPKLQRMARQALVDGLIKYDREQGWRGSMARIDAAGDWGQQLSLYEIPTDIQPWRLGAVLEVNARGVIVGLRPPRLPDGTFAPGLERVTVPFDEMKWAAPFGGPERPKGAAPKQPSEVVVVGDVIYVSPKDQANPNNLAGIWQLMQVPEVGGAITVMDPHTGRVLATIGGFSFAASQFDRAVQARRQPGSSFKPFVYAAAMDNGYKPTSVVLDAPITIEQTGSSTPWTPQNYGGKFYGPSTLRVGIERSRNLMTVRLAQDMGMPMIVEYARRFGIYDDMMPVLSMSLGAGETTLLRMVAGYAMLANGGRQVKATLIDRIQDRWGRSIWRHDDRECRECKSATWQVEPDVPDDRKQIIDPHTAYQITSMMEGVVQRGTATLLKQFIGGMHFAGKTGTTNESKDTWFIGYTPDMVVGVFLGYDNPRPMGQTATGGQLAVPIVGSFLKMALADRKPVPFRQPPGIKQAWVSLKTGARATPGSADVVQEAFKPYEEPDDEFHCIGFCTGGENPSEFTEPRTGTTAGSGPGSWPPPVPRPGGAPPRGGLW